MPQSSTAAPSTGPTRGSEQSLVRAVGVWGLAAAIANVTIGGGIFRLPASVAGALGAAAPLAYLVCAVAMGLIVMCIAEAGSRVSLTGGPYAYVELAFGPYFGFQAGVMLWLLGTYAVAAVATVYADNAATLIPALAGPIPRASLLIATFAIVGGVNTIGVSQGSRLNQVTTVAKLAPLLLLIAVGVFSIKGENLAITTVPASGDVLRASIVLIFAFSGIETALVPSGEVQNPSRTVPRAIFVAMIGITLLYVALQYVAQGVLGASLATSATPLADAAGVVLGPWGRTLLLIGVVVSTFGYLSGMALAVPRALYAFARDGFLPAPIATVHPTWKTPHIAIALQLAVTCTLAITSGFGPLAIIANVAALLVYFACAVAALELRRRNVQSGGIPFRVPGAGVVPILACVVIIGLLTSITLAEWTSILVTAAVASGLYVLSYRHRAAKAKAAATA
ncbi:APC family permease [Gemmatimonas groenlandica]|uniref:Arginine/agmatine antiporter n=1 Tax=Gemmatimonas groenlandica TaxID=2732249 RepID=A0A6M4IT39_9BACT|nr:APC family permease [Gemmatimonas groenlandica]QJR35411.1 APC family permease [Gemmatimonas groenlandica]